MQTAMRTRIARSSDHPKIASLCKRAVGEHDYVIPLIEETTKKGSLFLAFEGKELVGMTNFSKLIDGSGWLSMARTDPDHRGKGVAGLLQRSIASYAKRRKINTLRLWTLATNSSAIRTCLKGGFRPVSEVFYATRTVARLTKPYEIENARFDMDAVLESKFLSMTKGYFAYGWYLVKASRDVLRAIGKRKQMYVLHGTTFVLLPPEDWRGKNHSEFALLSCGSIKDDLAAVLKTASSLGIESLGAYLPYDKRIINQVKRLGFVVEEWAHHSIVMEKSL